MRPYRQLCVNFFVFRCAYAGNFGSCAVFGGCSWLSTSYSGSVTASIITRVQANTPPFAISWVSVANFTINVFADQWRNVIFVYANQRCVFIVVVSVVVHVCFSLQHIGNLRQGREHVRDTTQQAHDSYRTHSGLVQAPTTGSVGPPVLRVFAANFFMSTSTQYATASKRCRLAVWY